MGTARTAVAAPSSTSALLTTSAKWLNCFQYCSKACKILGHVMVLMVLCIVFLSYYAVVGAVYGPAIFKGGVLHAVGCIAVIICFTIIIVLLVWSYLATVLTDPGRVPHGWHPFLDEQQARHELERMAYSDYHIDRRDPRRPRFCKRCERWKPERSHHCSVMGRCVLKMDHYCIWVVNCVGLLNYKFFLLFLVYTLLASLMAVCVLAKPVIDFFNGKLRGPTAPVIFISAVTDAAFTASVAGFLVMHLQLLAANCTTIEMYEKDRIQPWPYNRGMRRNLAEVFGRSKLRWLLPLHTKEERRLMLDSCLNNRLLPISFASSA